MNNKSKALYTTLHDHIPSKQHRRAYKEVRYGLCIGHWLPRMLATGGGSRNPDVGADRLI
jgi:hypothetical protein